MCMRACVYAYECVMYVCACVYMSVCVSVSICISECLSVCMYVLVYGDDNNNYDNEMIMMTETMMMSACSTLAVSPGFFSMNLVMAGRAHYHLHQYDKARDLFMRATRITPKTPDERMVL